MHVGGDSLTTTTASMTGTADVEGTLVSDGGIDIWAWSGMCSGSGTFSGSHD